MDLITSISNTHPPRQVMWTASGFWNRAFIYGISLFLLGVVGWMLNGSAVETSRYAHTGVLTTARVDDKHSSSGKTTHYYLDVDYRVGSETVYTTVSVDEGVYEQASTGSRVEVTYIPNATDEARYGRVGQADVDSQYHDMWTMLGVLGAFCAFLIWLTESSLWSDYRLLRDGFVAQAVVDDVSEYTVKGNTRIRINYRFEWGSGSVTRSGNAEYGPPTGSSMWIIYDPVKTDRNRPIEDIRTVAIR